jgi:hypothetical protein
LRIIVMTVAFWLHGQQRGEEAIAAARAARSGNGNQSGKTGHDDHGGEADDAQIAGSVAWQNKTAFSGRVGVLAPQTKRPAWELEQTADFDRH